MFLPEKAFCDKPVYEGGENMGDLQQELKDLKPQHEFFIGIDSDGCAFDTMEIKHKECFCPQTIKHWHLQPVSK